MTEFYMSLTGIAPAGPETYLVRLTSEDGEETQYKFEVVQTSVVPVVRGDEAFGREVSAYGRDDLIYKLVSAFHAARREKYGRPTN